MSEALPPGAEAELASGPGDMLRKLLGLRRSFVVDRVRYRERQGLPLRRSLSPSGPGHKDFDVLFPSGESMRIRVTPTRRYADITGLPEQRHAALLERLIAPGMRVCCLHCHTGWIGAVAALSVGPSGAVLACDRDHESIRYARRRYAMENIAFEIGGEELLSGEIEGAFDAAVSLARPATDYPKRSGRGVEVAEHPLDELWRVVRPGGWVLYRADGAAGAKLLAEAAGSPPAELLGEPGTEARAVLLRKPAETNGPGLRSDHFDPPEDGPEGIDGDDEDAPSSGRW